MARCGRRLSPADVYHVVSRGTGRQLIFECDADREHFLGLLGSVAEERNVEIYAWVLMGNHFHLLLHAPIEEVSRMLKHLCSSYAQWFNRKTGRVGHLFQERFKSEPVCDDAYLLTVLRYIHENPVKAGLADVESYRWSSYAEYVGKPSICATAFPLGVFDGVSRFREFHRDEENRAECLEIDPLRKATRAMPDEVAIEIAEDCLSGVGLGDLKTLSAEERRARLRELKDRGLTIRQIERLTGIGRNTVARA